MILRGHPVFSMLLAVAGIEERSLLPATYDPCLPVTSRHEETRDVTLGSPSSHGQHPRRDCRKVW